MNNDTPTPKRQRWRRRLSLIAITLALLLFAIRYCSDFWLFHWQEKELSFHPSWSETHRKQMKELGDMVRYELILSYRPNPLEEEYTPSLGDILAAKEEAAEEGASFSALRHLELSYILSYMRALVAMRDELAELYGMLQQVAESGQGEAATHDGFTMAHLAARSSKLDLLRELVRRGANPNAIHSSAHSPYERPESVFQSVIACVPCPGAIVERASQHERLETLSWLLEHGAHIPADSRHTLNLAFIADVRDQDEEESDSTPGSTAEWLLDHGLSVGDASDSLCILFCLPGTLPTVQRFLQKGYLSRENASELLHQAALCTEPDAADKVRWALSLGGKDDEALMICCTNLRLHDDTTDEDDMRAFSSALQVLDVLLEHGAELDSPECCIPKDEPQKSLYTEILEKHHILLENKS